MKKLRLSRQGSRFCLAVAIFTVLYVASARNRVQVSTGATNDFSQVLSIERQISRRGQENCTVIFPRGRISRMQEAYCQLDDMNIPIADIPSVCSARNERDVDCIASLHRQLHSRPKVCISSDFTDVKIDVNALLSLRALNGLNANPRYHFNASQSSKQVLLTICMKNESRLLVMSIVWHLLIGVDHVFVCNHSPPGGVDLKETLLPLQESGFVTIKQYNGTGAIQQTCYDEALEFGRVGGYTWQGGLDCDEFLVLSERFSNVLNFLEHAANLSSADELKVGGIGINWIYQPSYNQTKVHYPTDLYTTPVKKVNFVVGQPDEHVKSFTMIKNTKKWNFVHFPMVFNSGNFSMFNTAGFPFKSTEDMFALAPSVKEAAVLHFAFRTAQEHMAKRERGRATIDCESNASRTKAANPCSMVHKIRESPQALSLAAQEYAARGRPESAAETGWELSPSAQDHDFGAVMLKVASQVEAVLQHPQPFCQ